MGIIKVNNLTFGYEGGSDDLFKEVSFQIDTKWKLGLIGRNGRGKTTLMKLLKGELEYRGSITKTVEIDYFPFEVKNKEYLTIDVVEEISDNFELWKLNKEMTFLDLDKEVLYRPFNTLSNGEQTKILLAILFLRENNFILIDEPTNHLDIEARIKVNEYLNKKSGFILISHDRDFLDNCVDHIMSINKTDIDIQKGNYTSWHENKLRLDNFEINKNEKLKKDIKKLEKAAKRTSNWSDKVENTKIGQGPCDRGAIGHKAANMMKRSKAIDERVNRAIEEKKGLLKNIENKETLKISADNYHKEKLIEVRNVSIKYYDKEIFEKISFEVNKGDRICIIGKNGVGKSSLIKAILGKNIDYTGEIFIEKNIKISYINQEIELKKEKLDEYAQRKGIDQTMLKTILRKLGFEREKFDEYMCNFSDGQKKKVELARSLCTKAHIYVWDEPFNYLDIISREQLEELINESNATFIFVEHDVRFIENVGSKKIILS